jgi:hypothetical protein
MHVAKIDIIHALSPVVEIFQIFLRDTHISPKCLSYEKYCERYKTYNLLHIYLVWQ